MVSKSHDAYLFDIGNVLIGWDPDNLLKKILPDRTAIDAFRNEAVTWERILRMDRGQDWEAQLSEIAEQAPGHLETARVYRARYTETISGTIEPVVALRDRLRAAGRPVYALSNYGIENFERTLVEYPFLEDFDGRIVSGYEGLIKPEREIYELAIDRFGLEPARTVFIDDRPENIDAASELGFRTHLFTSPDALLSEASDWR